MDLLKIQGYLKYYGWLLGGLALAIPFSWHISNNSEFEHVEIIRFFIMLFGIGMTVVHFTFRSFATDAAVNLAACEKHESKLEALYLEYIKAENDGKLHPKLEKRLLNEMKYHLDFIKHYNKFLMNEKKIEHYEYIIDALM